MKAIIKFFGFAALMLGMAVACSPEEIHHPTEAGIASAQEYEPIIMVDQEINQVSFSVDAKGIIPVWLFQDKNGNFTQYSAQNGLKKIFTASGDYTVRLQIMNANGVSPDYVERTFHIDNTIMNFDKYVTFLAGGTSESSKQWRVDNSKAGHLGCGEPGTTGVNWWSAQPDEKSAFGVYDDILTFTSDYGYTYDPGEGGTVYCNKDVTEAPYGDYRNPDEDYMVPVSSVTSSYSFEVEGETLYLVLPAGTHFPYIPNNDFVKNPRLKVESATAKAIELVTDNGSIAWHISLTSGAAPVTFNGFKYDSEFNIWKPADAAHSYSYYYAPGWTQIADPETTCEGGTYTLSFPSGTSDQWQAQFFIIPDSPVALEAAKSYDFSVILNSSKDIKGVTVKLTDTTDDGNFLFTERVDLTSYEDMIFYASELPGIDAASVKMVFDFGGNPDGTEVTIKNIVLKDHANDDGTVLPDIPDPDDGGDEEEGAHYGIDEATNMWRNSDVSVVFWYADGGWGQIADPEYEWLDGDKKNFKVTMPAAIGGSEWMGQTHFTIDAPATTDKLYDFCATLNSTESCTCTVKLACEGDDANHAMFYVNDVTLTAFEDFVFKMPKVAPDIDYGKVAVFFDFGRTPAGAEVLISDVCFQEHQEPISGGGESSGEVTGTEIWDNSKVAVTYWYSDASWSGTLAPEISEIAGGWNVIIPDGIGGAEWMGQTHLTLDAPIYAAKKYQFKVTLNSSADCTCTVKLACEGDDTNHAAFYDGNVQLSAYEDVVYVQYPVSPDIDYAKVALFIDLGRTPAGSEVQIKDISLIEVKEPVDVWDPSKATVTYWYSDASWSGTLAPEISEIAGGWSVIIPDGIGGAEWMGQTHITLDAPIYAASSYNFSVKINSSEACTCTVKLACEGDDTNHAVFYDGNVQLSAYEDFVYEQKSVSPDIDYAKVALFIDLGRTPAGAEVQITDIHLIEQ